MLEKVMQQKRNWRQKEPKWTYNSIENKWKNDTKTHHEKWCKNEALKISRPQGARRGTRAQSARRGKEFLRRLQVKVPSRIQHHQKTNIWQTTKKQSPQNLWLLPRTHTTCQQARFRYSYILGPRVPRASWAKRSIFTGCRPGPCPEINKVIFPKQIIDFQKKWSPPGRRFFIFFIKIIEIIKNVFFSNLFAPWQETFADAGDGDGGTI